jgi:hypothetical protein
MSLSQQKPGWTNLKALGRYSGCLLLAIGAAAGNHDHEIADLVKVADDNATFRPELAVVACAQAMRLDAGSLAAQECLKKIRSGAVIDNALAAAAAAQAGGRIDDAKKWCDAVLIADSSKSGKCVDINKASVVHRQQILTLEQARVQLQRKNLPEADKLLSTLQSSTFPDVVGQALALAREESLASLPPNVQLGKQYLALNQPEDAWNKCKSALEANPSDPNALQCMQQAARLKQQETDDPKAWATIESAKALLAQGKREDAARTLTALLTAQPPAAPLGDAVRISAQEALTQTEPSSLSVFSNALKSQWIMEFLAGLAIVAGLWFGLHVARWMWRRFLSLWARLGAVRWIVKRENANKSTVGRMAKAVLDRVGKIRWTFNGVKGDDDGKLGASDAVLDALRRVPNEVAIPIWTPGWLVLHPTAQAFQAWEDFGGVDQPPLHEEVFRLLLNQGRAADNALADAFQNLQFNVGTVGLGIVARFWRAILDWWRDGQPGFSGVVQETATADGTGKQIVIRLTCSGGPYGTVSVLASTKREDGVDVVALTASRAAYKLLSRLSPGSGTTEQIDGFAAFRQGAKMLASYVRSLGDAQADQARAAEINKAIVNLEFARQAFCRDTDHPVYYLEAVRFEAVAYALLGRPAAALARFEELEDKASGGKDVRSTALTLEAGYNQGVVHLASAASSTNVAAEIQRALELFLFVEGNAAAYPIGKAATARRCSVLAAVDTDSWPQLDRAQCTAVLNAGIELIAKLDDGVLHATGAERRAWSVLAMEARRDLAIAGLRFIAAFEVFNRGPYDTPASALANDTVVRIQQWLRFFSESDTFGSVVVNALACRSYALLLLGGKWRTAESYARQALALDKACELACYVAAEACLQQGDPAAARQYLTSFAPTPIRGGALCRLKQVLNPAADAKEAVAALAACG